MRRLSERFRRIASKGNFETEWVQFESNLISHKYKIMFLSTAVCFPLYKPFLQYQWIQLEEYFAHQTAAKLKKHEPIPKITEAFLK